MNSTLENDTKQTLITDDDIRIEHNEMGEEVYVFDPYNPLNKAISRNSIETILKRYGIDAPVHNIELYKRAFIHRSHLKRPDIENKNNNIRIVPKPEDCLPLNSKSNERLEFVGDGVLECITKYILYRRFPKENEGFMTEKKIALVKNEAIGRLAYEMGLHEWVILSKHAEQKQIRTNLKKLGCLFESFLGALFLDFNKIKVNDEENWFSDVFITGPGFQMAQIFIEKVYEKHVDWISLIKNDDNYKNILQVRIQKEFKVTPDYLEECEHSSETGYHMGVYLCLGYNIHKQSYHTATNYTSEKKTFAEIKLLHDQGEKFFLLLGEAKHKIKKKAEQQACLVALDII